MKNFLIVVCVILVVCFLGYMGQYMNDDIVPVNTVSTNQKQNVSSSSSSKVNTTKNENEVQEEEKVEVDEKEEHVEEEEKEEEPVVEENSISSEDKAIDLAKKEYGDCSDVYFRIEQVQSNGVYIISVRDNETTKDLAWYTVNVNDGTVK